MIKRIPLVHDGLFHDGLFGGESSWDDPTIPDDSSHRELAKKWVLCVRAACRYFDGLTETRYVGMSGQSYQFARKEITLCLSDRYSAGTCYEFVRRRASCYPVMLIDGEWRFIELFVRLADEIVAFLKEHGKCFLSIEVPS